MSTMITNAHSKVEQKSQQMSGSRRGVFGAWKEFVIVGSGFGLGGLVWGLEAYRGTVGSDATFTNPFSFLLGAVAMGVFGGLALSMVEILKQTTNASKSEKNASNGSNNNYLSRLLSVKTARIVGLGTVGWLVAFVVPAVLGEWILAVGAVITPFIIFFLKTTGVDLVPIFVLKPSLIVGQLWFHFLIGGLIVGIFYFLTFRTKIFQIISYGAGGFAIASLIGPILGNIVGNVFDSLLISYLVTFLIIGVSFGKFLMIGIYRGSYRKAKEVRGST